MFVSTQKIVREFFVKLKSTDIGTIYLPYMNTMDQHILTERKRNLKTENKLHSFISLRVASFNLLKLFNAPCKLKIALWGSVSTNLQ